MILRISEKFAVLSDAHQIQVDAPLVDSNGLKVKHSTLAAAFMDSLSESDKTGVKVSFE